jgi:hypothetical protein
MHRAQWNCTYWNEAAFRCGSRPIPQALRPFFGLSRFCCEPFTFDNPSTIWPWPSINSPLVGLGCSFPFRVPTVLQFTLTCSHRPIFICFVCIRHFSAAAKYPHLRSIVQQKFSKCYPCFHDAQSALSPSESVPDQIVTLAPSHQLATIVRIG